MVEYTIINSAVNRMGNKKQDKTNTLVVIHNAGFFSCSTVALQDIVHYYIENKRLPDEVDRSAQYLHYKANAAEDITPKFYEERTDVAIPFSKSVHMNYDCMSIQFDDYANLPFDEYYNFVQRYFYPSQDVGNKAYNLIKKYNLDLDNICGVFYRGNDKAREMKIAPYSEFIDRAKEVRAKNPDIKFLVQPDETEFLLAFKKEFPDAIYFKETPSINKKDSAVFYEMKKDRRIDQAQWFMAATLVISRCKHIITHSGNCALWAMLYRGNAENVYQYFNGEWKHYE